MPLTKEQAVSLNRGDIVILDDTEFLMPPLIVAPGTRRPARGLHGRVWSRQGDSIGPAYTVRWFTGEGHLETAVMRDYELSVPEPES